MCGISGSFGNCDAAIAASMAKNLSHRGPDGIGRYEYELDQGRVAFGQSRLAIVDLEGSWQPIESDHGCVLIQNGEIYNYQQLRGRSPNYPWRTGGDAEAILSEHRSTIWSKSIDTNEVRGTERADIRIASNYDSSSNLALKHVDWVSRLDGVWGFALWDPRHRELILCRDPLGVNPLVRTILPDGTLLFASEVKAFHAHPEFKAMPDLMALQLRLAYEYPLDQTTLFSNVTSVAAGTIEVWKLDGDGKAVLTGVAQYSHDEMNPGLSWNPQDGAQFLLNSLQSSIEDRLMADVPVGIVLSGGLDSSMVASLAHSAANSTSNPVPECWTIAGSKDNPDLLAARLVAEHHDLTHHVTIMEEDAFWKRLPSFVWSGEDLDISVLFWQPLFEEMSKKVRVGLCGQGADELHAGYPRYRNLQSHANLIKTRLEQGGSIRVNGEQTGAGLPYSSQCINPHENLKDLQSALQFELDRGQLTNFQLRLGDRHSMAYGLEVRVPFLGKSHRDASLTLPLNWKLSATDEKMALREAANLTNLPKEIVRRPKVPAGTATAPSLVSSLMEELTPMALEWSNDYGSLTPMLKAQPDMAIGLRLFHAMHLTDPGLRKANVSLLDVMDDVTDWSDY